MIKKGLLPLSEAAKRLGISTKTLRRWDLLGKISVARTLGGQRRVPIEEIERLLTPKKDLSSAPKCCVYIRVRLKKNLKTNLNIQEELIKEAQRLGYQVTHVITEVGSSLKKVRPKLKELFMLINQKEFDVLVIDKKETFLPFGFDCFEELLLLQSIRVVAISSEQNIDSKKETSIELLIYLLKTFKSLNLSDENFDTSKKAFSKFIKILKQL